MGQGLTAVAEHPSTDPLTHLMNRRVRRLSPPSDPLAPSVGRAGGDEFLVVCEGISVTVL